MLRWAKSAKASRLDSALSTVSSRKNAESLRAPACARRACTSWPSAVWSACAKCVDAVRPVFAGKLAQPPVQPRKRARASQRNMFVHEKRTEGAVGAEQQACMAAGNVAVAPAERGSAEV